MSDLIKTDMTMVTTPPECNRSTLPEDSPDSRYQYRLGYEDGEIEGGLDCILGIPRPDDETLRDRYTPRLFGWL